MPDALDHTEATLCVERIAACQREHSLSDVQLVRKFPRLGSARTWSRLALKDWEACPLDRWLPALRAIVDQVEGRAAGDAGGVPVTLVTRHLAEAERCRGEGLVALARGHCRTARRAIEDYQRSLAAPNPQPAQP